MQTVISADDKLKIGMFFSSFGIYLYTQKISQNCLHLQTLNKPLTLKLLDGFKPLLLWHVPITLLQRSTPQPCPRRISRIGWKRKIKKEKKRKNEDVYIIKEQIYKKFKFLVRLSSDTLHF